jgi:hypothetical protein
MKDKYNSISERNMNRALSLQEKMLRAREHVQQVEERQVMIKHNALEGDDVKKAVRLADKLRSDFQRSEKAKKDKMQDQISTLREKNLKQKE